MALAAKVKATSRAIHEIWGIDVGNTTLLAQVLAAYISMKPSSLLPLITTICSSTSSSTNDAFTEAQELLLDPLWGISVVAQVGLSFHQYRQLVSLLSHTPTTHQPLCIPSSGQKLPQLLPLYDVMHSCWRSEIAAVPGLHSFTHHHFAATVWPLEDILNYIFSHPLITSFLTYTSCIDIIRWLDEYPQGGWSVFAESYSLRNSSIHSKALMFQFLSVLSDCTSHSGNLEELLAINHTFLTSILTQGYVTICPYGASPTTLPVTLRVTADDPMLRFFLRRTPSNSEYGCLYCFWLRAGPSTQDSTLLRVASLRAASASFPGHGGYSNPLQTDPMVPCLQLYNVVFCVLHVLSRLGETGRLPL
jgi:hypothetical protein